MDATKPQRALIIAGGNPVKPVVLEQLDDPAFVIAADSGLDEAFRVGLEPDLVVGDMDSVSTDALQRAENRGITIERHPVAKDATDLELAIDAAAAAGYERATIIGGTGGRMAHTLANALLLLKERSIDLDWRTSRATITAIREGGSNAYRRADGPLLSVLAVGRPAKCESEGLRWQLTGRPLEPGSTRGISNEIVTDVARVSVMGGQVLTVHERNQE
ncbi:MAG: thiamine diphosphokinase [Acidimicrobiia bacterium]|nr:thiamine diphosphokinase [Acidimicrobiia bacterium]